MRALLCRNFSVLGVLLAGLSATAAEAQTSTIANRTPQPVNVNPLVIAEAKGEMGYNQWWHQPDLLGFSVGYFDALRDNDRTNRAIDFRAEYRSGLSLLPLLAPQTFADWDSTFQVRPVAGVEATSDGALYGYGGFVYDIFLTRHVFVSPSTVVGLFYRGNGKRLGSVVEFRSTIEAGYRFDNNLRISASLGHISNAGLSDYNPGTEIISGNVYVPTDWVFGR
jgi:lipid A 3-O-deacylase